jgi:hypothetical protein
MTVSNRRETFPESTFLALDAFIAAYQRRTGKRLSLYTLSSDAHQLRAAVEDAIVQREPALYQATERLVLALRAAPLPMAA